MIVQFHKEGDASDSICVKSETPSRKKVAQDEGAIKSSKLSPRSLSEKKKESSAATPCKKKESTVKNKNPNEATKVVDLQVSA